MSLPSIIVLGGTGLIGSAICLHFSAKGHDVLALDSKNYAAHMGAKADILINCNGNSYRFKANKDPRWDFDANVLSVEKSLFEFTFKRYIHFSTVDVYPNVSEPGETPEYATIDARRLHPYGFHKWMGERLVERFAAQPLILRTGTVIGPGLKKGPLYDLLRGEPLHMSPESELSLIDTETIVEAVAEFIVNPPAHTIVNLTGTGPAQVGKLCADSGLQPILAPGAERVTHRYNVNNDRLRALMKVASSQEMGARFLANALKELS